MISAPRLLYRSTSEVLIHKMPNEESKIKIFRKKPFLWIKHIHVALYLIYHYGIHKFSFVSGMNV